MPFLNRTYRIADGEQIDGRWRYIFIKNGDTYYLNHLSVYADGIIQCGIDQWDFATFQQKVASGWVATTFPQGAHASAHHLAGWRFDEPRAGITAQQLIAEVADEIERLAGRPTTQNRCGDALVRYLDEPTDEHLAALRDAYLAVPKHLRRYLLSDQDSKDWPLRALVTPVGELLVGAEEWDDDLVVKPSDRDRALKYFQRNREENQQRKESPPWWEDDAVTSAFSVVRFNQHNGSQPYLANDYPAPSPSMARPFPPSNTPIGRWERQTPTPASKLSTRRQRVTPAKSDGTRRCAQTGTSRGWR